MKEVLDGYYLTCFFFDIYFSGVELSNKFGAPEYIFNASNPFIFFIEHEKTNTVLFIGKVVNPSGEIAPSKDHPNLQDATPLTANRFGGTTGKASRCRSRTYQTYRGVKSMLFCNQDH